MGTQVLFVKRSFVNSISLFGKRLREERKRLGLSQATAGTSAGVSREMWGKYERGAMPGGDVLLCLAQSDFDMVYLFTGSHGVAPAPAPALSREEEVLLDNYRHCSVEMQQAAKTQLAAMAKPKGKIKKAS